MKRIVIVGCAAGAAVVILLIWLQSGAVSRGHRQTAAKRLLAAGFPTPAQQRTGGSRTSAYAGQTLAGGGTNSTTPQRLTLADIEPLLQRPSLYPHEVPSIEDDTEKELVVRYRRTDSIVTKFGILQVLALGGSSNCIPLFTHAIYGEFAGRRVSGDEHAKLLFVPMLLGFLAHREPAAVEALRAMIRPGAVTPDQLWWQDPSRRPTSGVLLRAYQGLGASGRAEVKEWLGKCLALPPSSPDAVPEMASAAHKLWLVETYGFEDAVGRFNGDANMLVPSVSVWGGTPEGKAWRAWKAAVRRLHESPEE